MIESLDRDLLSDKPDRRERNDPISTCNPAPPSHRPTKLPTKVISTLEPKSGAVRAVRFNADGNYVLLCTSTDRSIKLYSPAKNLLLKTYKGHNYDVLDIRCSFDNASICSASADKNVFLWDVATGNPTRKLKGHLAPVNCVQFNEDASVVVSGSVDNSVKLWDNRSRNIAPIQSLDDAKDSITCLDVSNHEVLTGSADARIRLYDLRKGELTSDFMGSPVSSARLSNDGQCVLVGTMGDQTVRLLDKHSGELLNEYKGHKNLNYKLESGFAPGDAQVVSGSEDGRLLIWDLIDAKILTSLDHPLKGRAVHSVAVHPENYLVVSAQEGKAFLWGPEDYFEES